MKKNKSLKKCLPIILVAVLSVVTSFGSVSKTSFINASAETIEEQYDEQSTIEVVSYLDVFEDYYDIAKERLLEENIEMPFTFVQFCEGYYSHEYDIMLYTDYVVDYATSYIARYQNTYNDAIAYDIGPSGSSSSDADYILTTKIDYDVTPIQKYCLGKYGYKRR